jgi:uncharacterized repeat protein (TIGR04052 family)
MRRAALLLILTFTTALAACGKSDPEPTTQDVTINFKALVSGKPFSCTQTYTGIGNNADPAKQVFRPSDLRFFVHNVRLVDSSGQDVSVTLTDDGKWQNGGLAMIDFEDGTGTCFYANGNVVTNTMLIGEVPIGTYNGLKFTVGVPVERNHSVYVDNQQSPLNLSAMYWSWTGGYRFMKIEGMSANDRALPGGLLHLGSSGCTANDAVDKTKGATCLAANRPEIGFASFDPNHNEVVVDIGTLFKDTDLALNTTGTAAGCMSALDDPECVPMIPKFGLAFGTNSAETQSIFTME